MDARTYLRALFRRIPFLLLCLILASGAGFLATMLTRETAYRAETTLVVSAQPQGLNQDKPSADSLQLGRRLLEEYADMATSRRVLTKALVILGTNTEVAQTGSDVEEDLAERISLLVSPVSGIATLSVEANSPEEAAMTANVVAELFLDEISSLAGTGRIRLLDAAIPPPAPVEIPYVRNIALGGMLGLAAALVLVYLRVLVKTA